MTSCYAMILALTENVTDFVEVRDGDDFAPDEVVDAIHGVGVDEAVAHPHSRPHDFRHFAHHFESVFNTIFVDLGALKHDTV